MIPAETLRELSDLRSQVAYYRERERVLFDERESAVKNIRNTWPKVTVSMARMLWAMARRGGIMEREKLLALAGIESDDLRSVDWRLKYIRKRIPGITIISHYGLGYELAEPWASRVKSAAKGREA
jgi:hypothetical protein